ncbi:MAG TPA: hypothetical protein VGG64_13065 [Pirellulales bacterium]|jgi:hypothetical protein|nr:hypothetical protein [Pirellulales bacterium]
MSHVLKYGGQYFRLEIAEVASPEQPDKPAFVIWCSEAFKDLADMPRHTCSRFIGGSPLPTYADSLRHAYQWIKRDWDAHHAQPTPSAGSTASVVYTVWVFKGDAPFGFEFEEFADAKTFAAAAEKSTEITKVGIKNNESPQYLTVWEKS